jgi:uncharacterized membrane protein
LPFESTFIAPKTAPDHTGAVSLRSDERAIHTFTLWQHRSLPRTGFVWFIAATALVSSLPLFAVLGTKSLWGLMPFWALALAGIWCALQRNHSDSEISETLLIWHDRITLVRNGPRKKQAEWTANPYWVTPVLHASAGPVPNYITLRGGDREVELGAFLVEPERIELHTQLTDALRKLRLVDIPSDLRTPAQCAQS